MADAVSADAPTVIEKRDPNALIGIDRGATGSFEYISFTGPRYRTIAVEGLVFERTRLDSDGVSLYRRERF